MHPHLTPRRRLLLVAWVVAAMIATGCGRDSTPSGAAPNSGTATTLEGSPTSVSSTTTREGTGSPNTDGAPTTLAGDTTSATSPKSTIALKVTFSSSCVRPGKPQTIMVDMGHRGVVAFEATYSDGKKGGYPENYGGNGGGSADETGRFESTWVVASKAPAGVVQMHVFALDGAKNYGDTQAQFHVADPSGRCG